MKVRLKICDEKGNIVDVMEISGVVSVQVEPGECLATEDTCKLNT